jgi:hypothetical protein
MSESSDPRKQYCSLVDLNTVSGSSERIRNTLGGYFYTDTDSHGLLNVPPSFEKMNPINNIHPSILLVESIFGDIVQSPESERGFGEGYSDFRKTQIPYTTFICRIEGDPTYGDLKNVLKGNKYWKSLFVGGTYGGQYISAMFNTGTYDNNYTVINLPYNNKNKIHLKNSEELYDFVGATYDYNRYYANYQSFAALIDSERKLPNWYVLANTSLAGGVPSTFGGEINEDFSRTLVQNHNLDYYTFNKKIGLIELYSRMATIPALSEEPRMPDPWTEQMVSSSYYINSMFPANYNMIPAAVRNEQDMRNMNIIFPANETRTFLDPSSDYAQRSHAFPYFNKITVSTDLTETSNMFKQKILDNKSDTIFMKILKKAFLEQTDNGVPVKMTQFMKTSKYKAPSNNTMMDSEVTSNTAVAYRTVDMIKMLMYGYENVLDESNDFQIMGLNETDLLAAVDTRGIYRSVNSKKLSSLIVDIYKTFGDDDSATKIDNITSLLNCQYENVSRDPDSIETLRPVPATTEVVAYRVEKLNRTPGGDSETTGVIQNFWMFPNASQEEIMLLDSQVKYDTNYEYKIYAYYAVKGYKYRYSDLQLTRIIGQVSADGYAGPAAFGSGEDGAPVEPPLGYCLEYYDPFTDNAIPDYLIPDAATYNISTEVAERISSLSGEAQRIGLSSFEGESGETYPPYVAQFNVTLQPSINIIEVPLLSKIYRILDNPPNKLDVVPAYTLNNDNTITFEINYETFSPYKYPRAISENDKMVKSEYINGNDISNTTHIQKETVSYPSEVEIYRLDTKPKSFEDFAASTPRRVSLKIEGSDFAYTTANFSDIIKSNHKYYYLFRVLNDNRVPGNVNTIVEAELVNDGGYKYSLFDVLFEEDLIEEEFTFPSTSFKNIFQLVPNMSQVTINTDEVNFQDTAKNQYENIKVGVAEDLIWGKTFKIRLTSKKTGKKIDLNITYSDPDINLEE